MIRRSAFKSGLIVALMSVMVVVANRAAERTGTVAETGPKDPDVPMTRPGEMLAVHETKFFHSSTFVQLEGGRILHTDGKVFTTSDDGGITWSQPFTRKDVQGNPVVGSVEPSLVKLSGRGIGLAARMSDPKAGDPYEVRRSTHMVFWRSEDGGETWQPPVRITPVGVTSASYQDVLLRTSSGRLVLPVFHYFGQLTGPRDLPLPGNGVLMNGQWVPAGDHSYDPRFSAVYVCYSDDDGRTWKRNRDGELMILNEWNANFNPVNESSVAEVAPGRLLMVMRNGMGRLFQAWSTDNGETWTRPQPTALASSNAPAQIRKLPNGHLLMVWNQESEEEIKRGFVRLRVICSGQPQWGQHLGILSERGVLSSGNASGTRSDSAVRPEQIHFEPGQPAPAREGKNIVTVEEFGRCAYPSVFVMKDRVLIAHTYSRWEEDPGKAQLGLELSETERIQPEAQGATTEMVLRRQRPGGQSIFERGL